MIKGVICPITGKNTPTHRCLECALNKERPDCKYDPMVLAQMLQNRRLRGLSVTEITSEFPRKTLLNHLIDYYISPDIGYYSVRGRWAHADKQAVKLPPEFGKVLREVRFSFPDIPDLSGQIDAYYPDQQILVDYKTTSRLPDQPKPEHIRQLNVYAELLRANGYPVCKAFVTYLTYSTHKQEAIPLWDRDKVMSMVVELLDFYQECLDKREVPPRELCAGPDKYFMCRYCPHRDICVEHPDWWRVDQ